MSAYPDEATLVSVAVAQPAPAKRAARPAAKGPSKTAKAKGRPQPTRAHTEPRPATRSALEAACLRVEEQVAREGPTPPGCPDDWFWHDNCHTQRRRAATLDSGCAHTPTGGDDVCSPRHGVWCALAMIGEPCACGDPEEVAVFDMEDEVVDDAA